LSNSFACARVICGTAGGALEIVASDVDEPLVFALRDMVKSPSVGDGTAHHQAQPHCATPTLPAFRA
jgi:hypothetical protein